MRGTLKLYSNTLPEIMTDIEFMAILQDQSKQIIGNITWSEDEDHSPSVEFRATIVCAIPCQTLSYALIHRGAGRVYGLDLGKDHHNPDCHNIGEKHKHHWKEGFRDHEAYVPEDTTEPVTDPCAVWKQFCTESNITHNGILHAPPPVQMDLFS
jgi:hypothetical protein